MVLAIAEVHIVIRVYLVSHLTAFVYFVQYVLVVLLIPLLVSVVSLVHLRTIGMKTLDFQIGEALSVLSAFSILSSFQLVFCDNLGHQALILRGDLSTCC